MIRIFRFLPCIMLCLITVACMKTYTCNCETVVVENATLVVKSKEEFRIKVEALNRELAEAACGEARSTIASDKETSLTDCGLR